MKRTMMLIGLIAIMIFLVACKTEVTEQTQEEVQQEQAMEEEQPADDSMEETAEEDAMMEEESMEEETEEVMAEEEEPTMIDMEEYIGDGELEKTAILIAEDYVFEEWNGDDIKTVDLIPGRCSGCYLITVHYERAGELRQAEVALNKWKIQTATTT